MNQRKSYLFGLRHQMSDINDVIITHVAIDTFIPGYIQMYMYIYMYIYVYEITIHVSPIHKLYIVLRYTSIYMK